MSTPKWSDDELDEFFRQSAEEADPPYDPAAWQDLKNRLNTHDRGLWLNTVSRWVLPVLVLLISTGGLIWYTRFPRVSPLKSLTGKSVNAPTTGKTPGTSPIGLGIPRPVSDPASRLVNRKTVPAGTGDPISNRVSSVRKKIPFAIQPRRVKTSAEPVTVQKRPSWSSQINRQLIG